MHFRMVVGLTYRVKLMENHINGRHLNKISQGDMVTITHNGYE